MRRKITNEIWEQIRTVYLAGIGLREIARKMKIPEGTVLGHAKRHGWTQLIQTATRELAVMQSDAITPVNSVPQSLAAILSERKDRTKRGLSNYAAEAAEQAEEHRDKLGIARNVRDVAAGPLDSLATRGKPKDGPWALMFEDALKHDKLQTAASKLARMLKEYKIKPRIVKLADETTAKGYHRRDFEAVWKRYLPAQSKFLLETRIATESVSLFARMKS
jgi:uncharacterized protein DUF3631